MVRNEVAESLKLEKRPVAVLITKVGGTEEELNRKLYKVAVCNELGKRVQRLEAVGISQISEDIVDINIEKVAHVFGVQENMIKRKSGPVDLLIGINYPNLRSGEILIKDNLAIRIVPLGVVVFGSGVDCCGNNQVRMCTVQLQPVDLTYFWNTETMGVNSSPCSCVPVMMSSEDREGLMIINDYGVPVEAKP